MQQLGEISVAGLSCAFRVKFDATAAVANLKERTHDFFWFSVALWLLITCPKKQPIFLSSVVEDAKLFHPHKWPRRVKNSSGRNFRGEESIWELVIHPDGPTVDGRNPANQLIDSLSHYLQGFIHPRWCRISSINSRWWNLKCFEIKKSLLFSWGFMIQFDWNTYFFQMGGEKPPPCSIFNQKKTMERCDQNFHQTWPRFLWPTGRSWPQNDPKDVSKEVWFVTGPSRLKAYKKETWGGGWVISDLGSHPNSKRRQWVICKDSKQKPMVFWSLQLNMQTETASLQKTRYFLLCVSMSSSFI